jgi:cobalt-zinc-cadmium efflux system membrane fusion protein
MKNKWGLSVAIVLIAASATGLSLNGWTRAHVVEALKQLSQGGGHGDESPPKKAWSAKTKAPWDQILTLNAQQKKAIGLQTVAVKTQTEPTPLRLSGTTDYDPATVTIVRTQFDSRVDKVLVDLGATVKVGQPLLELFSNDLAEAKSTYEVASSQWAHDKSVLDYKTPLAEKEALPRKELIEVVNDEAQSRLKMKLAKDKLLVYGLTEKEIENAKTEDGLQKAKMILRSRAAGVVVQRPVVKGNSYTSADPLMTLAALDHLWVRGNVSELDAEKVEVGQELKVIFPFSDRTIAAEVDYIDKAIDSESRSAKFRTSIPNPDNHLKAGMFVRVWVELSAKPGRTVIPRAAMVSVDRSDFVFVRKPGTTDQFERRSVFVAIEHNDIVIIAEPTPGHRGLVPGEEVVTTGSLLLEQMYEDAIMSEGGLLASQPGEALVDPLNRSSLVILTEPAERR